MITSEPTKKNKTFKLGKTENVCRGRRIADNLTADAEVREEDTGTQTLYIGNVVISQIFNIYISAKVFMFQLNKSRFLRVFFSPT